MISVIGVAILMAFAPFHGWALVAPYLLCLGVIGGHATWSQVRHRRSPRETVAIDATVWGVIMLMTAVPVLNTAIMAYLFVLVALLSGGLWRLGLLATVAGWYALSVLLGDQTTPLGVGHVVGVVFVVGGLAGLISRVRGQLATLETERSQMLGTVSHELRNSLTGMMGLTQIVGDEFDIGADEMRRLVGMAHQQAVEANEIIEDLLTQTRMEQSVMTVGREAVDINREVETTVNRMSAGGTEIAVRTEPNLVLVDGDPLRVRQILRNLVSNAQRYGGPSIRITTALDDDAVRVTVADDGDGVPRGEEKTIFQPYRRSTTARHPDSIGLGLWVCRQLADAMGGTLDYRRMDGWTQFSLALRVQPARSGVPDGGFHPA
jgi:signal transduction histidine kinase